MGGHVVLVAQNSQTHEELIRSLASDGYCALCFCSVEEGVNYLREPKCPASVVVFNVAMRRQGDFASVIQLGTMRPELQILVISHHPEIINLQAREHGLVFERQNLGPTRVRPFAADEESSLTPAEIVARGEE